MHQMPVESYCIDPRLEQVVMLLHGGFNLSGSV